MTPSVLHVLALPPRKVGAEQRNGTEGVDRESLVPVLKRGLVDQRPLAVAQQKTAGVANQNRHWAGRHAPTARTAVPPSSRRRRRRIAALWPCPPEGIAAVERAASLSMSAATTRSPPAARTRQISAPIPRPPPVTSARRAMTPPPAAAALPSSGAYVYMDDSMSSEIRTICLNCPRQTRYHVSMVMRTRSQDVTETVRDWILTGAVVGGRSARGNPAWLSDSGVSRTPVRAALAALCKGWARRLPAKARLSRALVRSRRDLRRLSGARRVGGPWHADWRQSGRTGGRSGLSCDPAWPRGMRSSEGVGCSPTTFKPYQLMNVTFHNAILALSGNPWVARLVAETHTHPLRLGPRSSCGTTTA